MRVRGHSPSTPARFSPQGQLGGAKIRTRPARLRTLWTARVDQPHGHLSRRGRRAMSTTIPSELKVMPVAQAPETASLVLKAAATGSVAPVDGPIGSEMPKLGSRRLRYPFGFVDSESPGTASRTPFRASPTYALPRPPTRSRGVHSATVDSAGSWNPRAAARSCCWTRERAVHSLLT